MERAAWHGNSFTGMLKNYTIFPEHLKKVFFSSRRIMQQFQRAKNEKRIFGTD
jgi:hypothetical protein